MMIKLKCLFLKLLKPLFIISLISFFTILVNCSVKADYVNFWSPFEYYWNNSCNINSNYWIACSKSSILLTNYDSWYSKSVSSLFRTEEWIWFYYKSNPNNLNPFTIQWVINTWFVLCSWDTSSIISWSSLLYADSNYCEAWYTKLVLTYSELLDFFRNHSPKLVWTYYPWYEVWIYFVYDWYYFTETLYWWADSYPLNWQYIVKDMWISWLSYDTLTYWDNVLQSPLWWDYINPDSEKVYYSDNNQVYYDTFKAIWFRWDLCYSNFSTWDLVYSWVWYFELFPFNPNFTWANVFDLVNSWGSNLNNWTLNNWYYWFNPRYNVVIKNPVPSNIYSLYSWVSKWNFYIFDKLYYNDFVDSYTFSPIDYDVFCNMFINWFDPDWIFTWQVSTSFTNIFTNSCIRNWNCLDDWHFILSWANELWYFSDDADIIDVFNSLYSQFKNAFKVDSSLVWTVWFLPTYIIFGFLLFVLYYIFKR